MIPSRIPHLCLHQRRSEHRCSYRHASILLETQSRVQAFGSSNGSRCLVLPSQQLHRRTRLRRSVFGLNFSFVRTRFPAENSVACSGGCFLLFCTNADEFSGESSGLLSDSGESVRDNMLKVQNERDGSMQMILRRISNEYTGLM